MPHFIKHVLIAFCVGVVFSVLGVAWWIMSSTPIQAALPLTSASTTPARYCSNWDFLNNTGQDVNDLHVRLKSVKSVSDVYMGPLNPFGAPDGTSGYDTGTDVYRLNFSGATVYNGDLVHIGLCSDAPLLRLDQQSGQPPFVWTQDGAVVTPNPTFTGLEWNWQGRTQLRVRIVNEQNMTVTLTTLNLLDASNTLSLDDLNADVTVQLPLVLELLQTPQTLAPQSDSFFDVFFDVGNSSMSPNSASSSTVPLLEPNHPYVIEAVLTDANDDGNSAHLYAQGLSPLIAVYLPAIQK